MSAQYLLVHRYYNGTEGPDDGPAGVRWSECLGETELRYALERHGLAAPAAWDMPIEQVIHQVNNVNGDEYLVEVVRS